MTRRHDAAWGRRGMTLLEVVIAMTILCVLLVMAATFLQSTSQTAVTVTQEAVQQTKLQNAADDISRLIRESSPPVVTVFRFLGTTAGGAAITYRDSSGATSSTQDALCLPTTRRLRVKDPNSPTGDMGDAGATVMLTSGTYATTQTHNGLTLASDPLWQGIVVYACYNNVLYCYVDRRYRDQTTYDEKDEDKRYRVTAVTASTITVAYKGGTISFSRNGTLGTSQGREVVLDNAAQFLYLPPSTATIPVGTPQSVAYQYIQSGATVSQSMAVCLCIRGVDKSRESTQTSTLVPTRELVTLYPKMRN